MTRKWTPWFVAAVAALVVSGCRGGTPTAELSPPATKEEQSDQNGALFSREDLPDLALSEATTPAGMIFQAEVAKYFTAENGLFPELRERLSELGFAEGYQTGLQAKGYTAEAPVQAPLGQWYMTSSVGRYDNADGADSSMEYVKQQHENAAIPSIVGIRYTREKDLGDDGWLSRWTQRYDNGVTLPAVTFRWRIANMTHYLTVLGLPPGENVKELDIGGLTELAVSLYKDNLELLGD